MKKQKLIRDKIPEIYPMQKMHIANDSEYQQELINKLDEEVKEFKESHKIEELADIIEVIYAITEFKGTSIESLEKIRLEKAKTRGAFKKRIIWEQR